MIINMYVILGTSNVAELLRVLIFKDIQFCYALVP